MNDQHILVIDDDDRLRVLLRRFLEESGFRVTDVGSASEARKALDGLVFDVLIIDIMMPGETGLEFLADIRKGNPVPALFLTAMSETEHRITGLETGADDYMSKPFEPRELVLRIKSILSRSTSRDPAKTQLVTFGPYSFDLSVGILMHSTGRIHMTSSEQRLMQIFASSPDRILSRDDIAKSMDNTMRDRSIDVAVARLRAKIEPDPRFPVYLQNIRNKGWLLRTDTPPDISHATS